MASGHYSKRRLSTEASAAASAQGGRSTRNRTGGYQLNLSRTNAWDDPNASDEDVSAPRPRQTFREILAGHEDGMDDEGNGSDGGGWQPPGGGEESDDAEEQDAEGGQQGQGGARQSEADFNDLFLEWSMKQQHQIYGNKVDHQHVTPQERLYLELALWVYVNKVPQEAASSLLRLLHDSAKLCNTSQRKCANNPFSDIPQTWEVFMDRVLDDVKRPEVKIHKLPVPKEISYPREEEHFSMVDFEQSIKGLLTNPMLMKSGNFNFNDPPTSKSSSVHQRQTHVQDTDLLLLSLSASVDPAYIGDMTQSDWMRNNLEKERLRLPDRRVKLLPVMLFIDATTLDKFGKHTATPILATLLIFSLAVLKMDISKTLLGFIPKCELHGAERTGARAVIWMRDMYMRCIAILVQQIRVSTYRSERSNLQQYGDALRITCCAYSACSPCTTAEASK